MTDLRKRAERWIARHQDTIDQLPEEAQDLVQELRVYQAELEIQNDELRHSMLQTEESNQRFARLYNSVPVGLLLVNPNGIIQQSNRAFQLMLGATETVVGKPMYVKIHPDDRNGFLARWRRFANPGHMSGHPIIVRLATEPLRWVRIERGRSDPDLTDAVSLVMVDITATRVAEEAKARAENELAQSQKMEAVGQLAGGVAHDFNNQLQVMLGYCELAGRARDEGKRDRYLSSVTTAIDNSRRLVDQLLAFSRGGQIEREIISVNELITDLSNIISRTFDPRIICEVYASTDDVRVLANKNQLHNALLNLCVNARDALVGGGSLKLSCRAVDREESWVSVFHSTRPPGQYVEVTVRDDGQGMAPDVLRRATEPFFTTKPKGSGTGLGLAAVYGMVDAIGGDFRLSSEVGRGTTAEILLPAQSVLHRTTKTYRPQPVTRRTQRVTSRPHHPVLIVDDEERLQGLAAECITGLGAVAITASNGREAVDLVVERGGNIAAIVMDLLMPKMDGAEATKHIKNMYDHIPVILATGYGSDDHIEEARRAGIDAIIHKPYSMNDLGDLMRKILKPVQPATENSQQSSDRRPLGRDGGQELPALERLR